MKKFAVGIAAGAALVYGGLVSAYAAGSWIWPERLPAPAISSLVSIDEKLRFLRENPTLDPEILAVGSSITWRQLAGDQFNELASGPGRFLNGGTGYLKIHQIRDLLDFYVRRYDRIRTVLILTGPPDFADCTHEPATMLDHAAATAYAFEEWPEIYFYLRYFAPQRYLRGAMTLPDERTPFVGGLFLDAYGSGPLEVPASMQRGLRYGEIAPDPSCADELKELAQDVTIRGLELVVVFAPIHPEYRRLHPEAVERMRLTARDLVDSAGSGVNVLWMTSDGSYSDTDFFDAFHLQWPAVQRLSGEIANAIAASKAGEGQLSHIGPPPSNAALRGL